MAFTGTDVITNRARVLLADTTVDGTTERWTDSVLLRWFNDGARFIAEKRPDSLLSAPYTLTTYADLAAIGDACVLDDRFKEPLVDYVCSRALGSDSQDERDRERAQEFYAAFVSKAGLSAIIAGG